MLKKDESELKVRIISVNDTLVTYKMWEPTDTTTHHVKRYEVLSFLYGEPQNTINEKNKNSVSVVPIVKPNSVGVGFVVTKPTEKRKDKKVQSFLVKYHSGEQIKGYVVNTKNDTLNGIISIKNVALNQLEVNFSDGENKVLIYNLDDIVAYGYDTIRYEKVKAVYKKEIVNNRNSKNGDLFLNLEVDGPSKLYSFYTLKFRKSYYRNDPNLPYYFAKMKRYFVLINPKGKKMSTKSRTIKACVNNLFNDNTQLMQHVRDKGVNANTLPATVSSYNEWYRNKNK